MASVSQARLMTLLLGGLARQVKKPEGALARRRQTRFVALRDQVGGPASHLCGTVSLSFEPAVCEETEPVVLKVREAATSALDLLMSRFMASVGPLLSPVR
jgi:hypothetical protein